MLAGPSSPGILPEMIMMPSASLRILVVDDHEIVRKGLCALIQKQVGWEVCGEAANGREAVEKAAELRPGMIIMDVTMPELDGVESARRIRAVLPDAKILMLSMHNSEEMAKEALKAGAKAYLLKTDVSNELAQVIQAVLKGRTYLSPKLERTDRGFSTFPKGLTKREREVLRFVAEGKTSKEVASALNISVKTVETHRTNVMQKLDLHSLTAITHYAIRNHIVQS